MTILHQTTPYPILYSFRRCPYAMRARLALYWANVAHEHREVNLKSKPSQMLNISPKGTVPILILNERVVYEESLDIMKWALGNPFLSDENKNLIHENDTIFKYALDRYKYPGRYPETRGVDYRQVCESFLNKIETHLVLCLEENGLTLTDMALFPFIRQFASVEPDGFQTQPFPKLRKWLDNVTASVLFQQIMYKHPFWVAGEAPQVVVFKG